LLASNATATQEALLSGSSITCSIRPEDTVNRTFTKKFKNPQNYNENVTKKTRRPTLWPNWWYKDHALHYTMQVQQNTQHQINETNRM